MLPEFSHKIVFPWGQEPFVPEDWATDWYCDKHRQQARAAGGDFAMPVETITL